MTKSTTEGSSGECPTCGKQVWVIPSDPNGDVTCPHCGALLSMESFDPSRDTIEDLFDRGVEVELDAEGQITSIRFSGEIYNDAMIERLAELGDIEEIDLRATAVTTQGAEHLRRLLPAAFVKHGDDVS